MDMDKDKQLAPMQDNMQPTILVDIKPGNLAWAAW